MIELIPIALGLIGQFSALAENPNVKPVIKDLSNWVGNLFSSNSAKEKLAQIEEGKADEKTVIGIEANLEFILEDNEQLQKELAEKIKQLEEVMAKEGISIVKKSNTMNISGTGNKGIQDVNTNQGDINISM